VKKVKTHPFASVILVAAIVTTSLAATQKQRPSKESPREQADFGADQEKLDRPVPVPDQVVQAIRDVDKAPPDELPAEWLLASGIHLDGPNEIDLIVLGTGGLRGAHTVPFWVFRKKQTGYELVLATGGDGLSVLKTRWKGFREINALGIGFAGREITTVTYRFDGQHYQKFNEKTESTNP
jgi:hypothetical protein